MQPNQTAFLHLALSGPSNHLFANKVISLQVPTLLSAMTMPPNHFEIPSSLPPLLPSLALPPPPGSSPDPEENR